MRRRLLTLTIVALALIVPAVALAAGAGSGSRADRSGDAAPKVDVVRASVTHTRERLVARISFRSAPGAKPSALVATYFGLEGNGRCDPRRGATVAYDTKTRRAYGLVFPAQERLAARASVRGRTLTLRGSGSALARARYDCAVVVSLRNGRTVAFHDRLNLDLRTR